MIGLIRSVSAGVTLAFFIGLFIYVPGSSADVPGVLLVGFGFVGSAIVFAGALIAEQLEKE